MTQAEFRRLAQVGAEIRLGQLRGEIEGTLRSFPELGKRAAFCDRSRAWRARQRVSMRQVHKAGEKAFVDYAAMRPTIIDAATGEEIAVELFVAVLGASNFTFAEVTRTQQSADWITSHVHAVEAFGGVPAV